MTDRGATGASGRHLAPSGRTARQIRAQEAEIDALEELWSTVLPVGWMPGRWQFMVWLRRYGFALAEKGITVAGCKLHQVTREANRAWTADDAIRIPVWSYGTHPRTTARARRIYGGQERVKRCLVHTTPS